MKHLSAESFTLGMTYPLSATAPAPANDPPREDSPEKAGNADSDAAKVESPLALEISPLGTKKSPEKGLVEVRVRNTSTKKLRLFLRRELISYQVSGPSGTTSCQMHPADRAPDRSQFTTIAPGSSKRLLTRLAEACPPGTWDSPGTYLVSGRILAKADGGEHGLKAFTGNATTEQPARLVVPGKPKESKTHMQLAPVAAPKD